MNDEEPPCSARRDGRPNWLSCVVHHYEGDLRDKAVANWAPGHYCDGSTSGSCCGPTRACRCRTKIAPFDCDDDVMLRLHPRNRKIT